MDELLVESIDPQFAREEERKTILQLLEGKPIKP